MTETKKPQVLIPFIVGTSFFMTGQDRTIISTALPAMAETFGVSPVNLGIAIVAYIVSLAVFVPVSGWLADRFGARKVFVSAIVLYTLGSILCGISSGPLSLTLARIVQGAGGAMILPVGRMIALHGRPKSEYAKAMVIVALFPALGSVFGPSVGGFITEYASSWRWIFFVNIPVGVIGAVLVLMFVDDFKGEDVKRLDWVGFVLTGICLSTFMYAIERIGHSVGDGWFAVGLLGVSLVAGFLAVRHARRKPGALMDVTLLKLQTLRLNVVSGSLFRITTGGLPFLLPLLFQVVFGMNAFHSGLITVCLGLGVFSVRLFVTKILRAFGFRTCLLINGVVFTLGLVGCAFLSASTPTIVILGLLFILGTAQGSQLSTMHTLAYSEVPPQRMGSAASFVQVFQQMSQGAGVAVGVTLLNIGMGFRAADILSLSDFVLAFSVLAVIDVIALISFLRLPADAGAEVSGHARKADRADAEKD